jgi:hypothetical protein
MSLSLAELEAVRAEFCCAEHAFVVATFANAVVVVVCGMCGK